MSSFGLPGFSPVADAELRRVWNENAFPEARHLVLEIVRYRRLLAEIDGHYVQIHRAWRDTVGGDLVGLHLLKQVMHRERHRV
ncbi:MULTISPECIES: hypothetical protein [unclassified Pseudomonas]|uniref:hypothetical protein n=1 Tax=unclassified Pseudomonas TaxID=196821 RepID=UPI002447CB02|nr:MULTISPECIES: hypothetical protein [unclassified Pseudomonas]MDG9928299.1 hypothetical protein [Pseudomonas sp. GD04042]MDH0481137.1 hypothetical protein [Pseudomonas sp. GD04015]MDH0604473.1 hypothetical protein [Pseudomonas sp. GD03869]